MCATTGTLVLIRLHKKADLKVNGMKDRKVRANEISFDLGKNEGYSCSSLGGRLIVVVRQTDDIFAALNLPTTILSCLNRFVVLMVSYQ